MTSGTTTALTVLVADDEPAMLGLISRYMKSLGFSVIEASEGDSAWDLAQNQRPDLVILDVMMPGMSGWEICKRLKSQSVNGGQFSETGVIMLTGIGENLNEMTSPLFAADAWLNKPFDFTDLDERIRETLDRYNKPMPARGVFQASEAPPPDSGWDVEVASDASPAVAIEEPTARPARRAKTSAKKTSAKKTAAAARPKRAARRRPKAAAKPASKKAAKAASKKSARRPAKAKARTVRGTGRPAAKKKTAKRATTKVRSRKR
jgi:DNA-binding response OmpR family regulator